jgi:hypothetical protein
LTEEQVGEFMEQIPGAGVIEQFNNIFLKIVDALMVAQGAEHKKKEHSQLTKGPRAKAKNGTGEMSRESHMVS